MQLLGDSEADPESTDANDDCCEHEDVNKRISEFVWVDVNIRCVAFHDSVFAVRRICLLYTSDAADE